MTDSMGETKTTAPATTSAALSIRKAADMQRRNFFPFSILWFSVVALQISVLAGLRMADTDIWVHLRNAQQFLAGHAFLHADSYTFTSAGAPLLNFEWLSELPYYFAFRAWNLHGLLAVYLLVLWLIFGSVYYLALRRGASCGDAALVTMTGVALGCYSFGPRMFHFGWLCLAVLLLVLERFQRTGNGLWVLPPLFALWINLHASWVFGFVVIGIYIVSGLVQGQWNNVLAERWTPVQLRKLLVAAAASTLALLANPYGYKLVLYPFELLSRQKVVRDQLTEWQSVDFHTFWGKLAMFMVLALLAAAWFSSEPWHLRDTALAAFAVWASLTHVRFLLFAAILLVPILGPRLRLLGAEGAQKQRPWLNVAATAVIAAIVIWSYPSAAQLQNSIDTQFPRDALRFMQQNHVNGRLFHYYGYGGYIEWYAPGMKTFADPRTDIFTYNGVLADYLKINALENSFELLDKYKIKYVLFPVDKHLTYVLDHSPDWHRVYGDSVVALFERTPIASAVSQTAPEQGPEHHR